MHAMMRNLVGALSSMHTSSESLPEFWRGLMAALSEATRAVTHICAHALVVKCEEAHPGLPRLTGPISHLAHDERG